MLQPLYVSLRVGGARALWLLACYLHHSRPMLLSTHANRTPALLLTPQVLASRSPARRVHVPRQPHLRRDRLFSDIFLRFLESFLGGRVLFIFVRNM